MEKLIGHSTIMNSKLEIDSFILRWIQTYLVGENANCSFKIRLILSELLANSFFHGNMEDENSRIYIEYLLEGPILIFKIKDQGSGFFLEETINKADYFQEESGRGLAIVRTIAESLIMDEEGKIVVTIDLSTL
jgi:anti-sigma regulatory factor (Ser/Thr protein kinase)